MTILFDSSYRNTRSNRVNIVTGHMVKIRLPDNLDQATIIGQGYSKSGHLGQDQVS